MTKIILEVTDEQFEQLDSIGLLNMNMAGVLYQSITITPTNKAEDVSGIFKEGQILSLEGLEEWTPKEAGKIKLLRGDKTE